MIRQCTKLFTIINRRILAKQNNCLFCTTSKSTDEEKEKEIERISKHASLDEPPTSCCQSGCSNCVFIVWAESLTAQMQDAGPEIAKNIIDRVEDPSMRAYLEMELRLRGFKKK